MHKKGIVAGLAVTAAIWLLGTPSPAQADGPAVDNTKENLYGIAKVETSLNIRKEAGTDQEIMGTMSSRAICQVEEESDGWYRIRYGIWEGYVSGDYLELAKLDELEEKESAVQQELEAKAREQEAVETAAGVRQEVVEYARQFVGNPYVWGGTSLTQGADCSGFVQSVLAHFDVFLPRTSREQSQVGEKKAVEDAQPGDLIFYARDGRIYHVVMYIGDGQVVHASCAKEGIKISGVNWQRAVWAASVL